MALYIIIILTGVPLGVVKFDDPKLWRFDEDSWRMTKSDLARGSF
jgi:hypothetical protein